MLTPQQQQQQACKTANAEGAKESRESCSSHLIDDRQHTLCVCRQQEKLNVADMATELASLSSAQQQTQQEKMLWPCLQLPQADGK